MGRVVVARVAAGSRHHRSLRGGLLLLRRAARAHQGRDRVEHQHPRRRLLLERARRRRRWGARGARARSLRRAPDPHRRGGRRLRVAARRFLRTRVVAVHRSVDAGWRSGCRRPVLQHHDVGDRTALPSSTRRGLLGADTAGSARRSDLLSAQRMAGRNIRVAHCTPSAGAGAGGLHVAGGDLRAGRSLGAAPPLGRSGRPRLAPVRVARSARAVHAGDDRGCLAGNQCADRPSGPGDAGDRDLTRGGVRDRRHTRVLSIQRANVSLAPGRASRDRRRCARATRAARRARGFSSPRGRLSSSSGSSR